MTNTELKLEKTLTELENIILNEQVRILEKVDIEQAVNDYVEHNLSEILDKYDSEDILEYFSENEIKEYVSDNFYAEDWVEAEEVEFSWNY